MSRGFCGTHSQLQQAINEDLAGQQVLLAAERAAEGKRARRHMLEALHASAVQPCNKRNCGSVCLCGSCHAREALKHFDPTWRP